MPMPTMEELQTAVSLIETACKSNLLKFLFNKIQQKDYYFERSTKEITLDNYGNGMVEHYIDLCVINPEKVKYIKRTINIEDAKINSQFPSFQEMLNCDVRNKLTNYGFWYKSTDAIISGVKEECWDRTSRANVKNNPKEIQWVFSLDSSRLKAGYKYRIVYGISIPGMYPINNGRFDSSSAPDLDNKTCSSSMRIVHTTNQIVYKINFDNSIDFEEAPSCYVVCQRPNQQDKTKYIQGRHQENIQNKTYTFSVKKPPFNSIIKTQWKIKG